MRKLILSIAAGGAALVAASPAAAQYYPVPQPAPYGYGNGYNGYGYNNGWGRVRALQARIDNVERQINWLDRRDRISGRSADRLRDEANGIEHRLHRAARYGLNPYEVRDIEVRIARLEQRVQFAAANRYGRYGYNNGNGWNGYNGGYYGRDRDDRDRDGREGHWEGRDRDDD